MTYKTHLAFSTVVTLLPMALLPYWQEYNPFSYISSIEEAVAIFFIIFVSSLAPDFDEPRSYLSSRFPWIIVSKILALFVRHRGVTHRLVAPFFYAAIFAIPSYFIWGEKIYEYTHLLYFFMVPYFFHIIGDSFTIGGIPRFWYPISRKTFWVVPKPLRFRTAGHTERVYFYIFFFGIIAEVYFWCKYLGFQTFLSF